MSTVLLTGASGFLGIHVAQRLLERGHRVRALARSPERVRQHLGLVGVGAEDVECVEGDMTDGDAATRAMAGCDAAVHAAATYSYRRADADRMRRENVRGTEAVLDAALAADCSCVVHVSSVVALLSPGARLDHRSPVGEGVGPYSRSKVASERVARARQASGAPVTVVYPGAVLGPDDPSLGESNQVVRDVLTGRVPLWPRGSLQWVDVRDTAEVVVSALDHPGERLLVPGETASDLHGPLSELTGRRLRVLKGPRALLAPGLLPGYLTGLPGLPHAVEGVGVVAAGTSGDATHTEQLLGVRGRTLAECLTDTVRWLVASGHLTPEQAGRLAD